MLRIGIVGAGSMGSAHAAGWSQTPAQIVGFLTETFDPNLPLARRYNAKVFSSLDSLLDAVDVVDICAPTHLHVQMILQAAARKKHIICEKPLALTTADALQAIRACKEAGVHLLVAHVVRYFPEYALAKSLVDQGVIGNVAVLRLLRGSYRPQKPIGNWFLDEAKSGGILMDLMIHDMDYARWIAGEVVSVFARKVTTIFPNSNLDYGLVILQHRGGAITHLAGAWAYPPPTFRTQFEIAGDRGVIIHDSQSTNPIETLLVKTHSSVPEVGLPSSPVREDPYTLEIKSFYKTITEGIPPKVTAEDALAAVQIAEAAILSAREGKAIHIEPIKVQT